MERVDPNALSDSRIEKLNRAQHALRAAFDPFFAELHAALKHLDGTVRAHEKALAAAATAEGKRATADRATRQLKEALEQPHTEVKNAESKVLVQEWFRDTTSKKRVERVVEDVLNEHLPEDGYDRVLFKAKCDAVFSLVLDHATHGRKWTA